METPAKCFSLPGQGKPLGLVVLEVPNGPGTVLGISPVLIRMSFKKRIGKFCNAYFPRRPKK
jgi:hypothetical protein